MNDQPYAAPRRTVIAWTRLLPPAAIALAHDRGPGDWCFFSAHEAAVVDAATRRMVPGPMDDGAAGLAGAAEYGVVRYIDSVLGLFGADGSWTLPAECQRERAWQRRIERLRVAYQAGVVLLDAQSDGDFTALSHRQQDLVLGADTTTAFAAILFQHTLEGVRRRGARGGWVA